MDEPVKVLRRRRLVEQRRIQVGAGVSPALYERLVELAAERQVSVSACAADVLANALGIPA